MRQAAAKVRAGASCERSPEAPVASPVDNAIAAADPDGIRQATAKLIEEMEDAARESGLLPGEPMSPLLSTLGRMVAWTGELTATIAQNTREQAEQVSRTVADARKAASAEIERERAAVSAEKAGIVRELSTEIAAATRTAQTWHRRTLDRNSLLATAGAMVTALLLVGGLGYWHGRAVGAASVQITEEGLQAAFQHGPAAAATWLGLMRSNDPIQALAVCKGAVAKGDDPRRACAVPMWLDPPTLRAPH